MLIIWSSAKTSAMSEVFGSVLSVAGVQYIVHKDTDTFPNCAPNDVVLCCGSKVVEHFTRLGLVPKNRTINSLREKPINIDGTYYLLTYDPSIVHREYEKKVDIQWDIKLACRLVKTGSTAPIMGEYKYVESYHELISEIDRRYATTGEKVKISADLETKGLDEYAPEAWIISISFTLDHGKSDVMYFEKGECPEEPSPFGDDDPTYWEGVWEQLHWLLTSDKISLRGANWKYDSRWIRKHWNIQCTNFRFDTFLVGSLLDENRSNSLKLHVKLFTDFGGYEDALGDHDMGSMDTLPKDILLPYAGGDTDGTQRVADVFTAEILKDRQLTNFYIHVTHPASIAFEQLERNGVCVDVPYYHKLQSELEVEVARLEHEMVDLLPNKMKHKHRDSIKDALEQAKNPLKPSIVKEYLFSPHGLNLKPQKFTEKTGEPSTAIDHIMMFGDHPEAQKFVGLIKEHGSAAKVLSTFVVGFLKHLRSDNKFHPAYLLARGDYEDEDAGTVSGRTSAKSPAVQCQPARSLVLTTTGYQTLGSLYANWRGVKVISHDGSIRSITGVFDNGTAPVYRVTTKSGKVIECTGNHPLLTPRGFVLAERLKLGDNVFIKGVQHGTFSGFNWGSIWGLDGIRSAWHRFSRLLGM